MKSKLIFRLASKRLDDLYNMWANRELSPYQYSIRRRELCVQVLKAYYAARGARLVHTEYAWNDSLVVEGGTYGHDVAKIIHDHCAYRTGASWNANHCTAIDSWGYVQWTALPTIIHYMAGRPHGKIG